ncbi:MAG TPA: ABC transporter permease [Thermoanaerobaculia bacterium]|nr:ABC transporter permease [Thermoanaerobaculia bacterium]
MRTASPQAPLLFRALKPRAARAFLSVFGISAAALLVLILVAARRSLETGVVAMAGSRDVDLWIVPRGTDNLIRTSGSLPAPTAKAARAIAGVARADPVLRTFLTVETGGREPRRLTLLALGVRGPDGLAGPPELIAGRRPSGPVEVALDRAAAFRLGVRLGDPVFAAGRPSVVVGLTRRTNLLATQLVFFDLAAVDDLAPVSFVAVRLAPTADAASVVRLLERALPGTEALTREDFVKASLKEATSGFRPLFILVSGLGLAVATALVALLLQGLVEDRRPDVAVLLTMGSPPAPLAGALVLHAALLAGTGSVAGAALVPLLAFALDRLVPTVELSTRAADALVVLVLFTIAGALGGLVPLARLLHIEPVEAFRP